MKGGKWEFGGRNDREGGRKELWLGRERGREGENEREGRKFKL